MQQWVVRDAAAANNHAKARSASGRDSSANTLTGPGVQTGDPTVSIALCVTEQSAARSTMYVPITQTKKKTPLKWKARVTDVAHTKRRYDISSVSSVQMPLGTTQRAS